MFRWAQKISEKFDFPMKNDPRAGFKTGRRFLTHLPQKCDLIEATEDICRSKGIEHAVFQINGAVSVLTNIFFTLSTRREEETRCTWP
jgi:hypothetical protein